MKEIYKISGLTMAEMKNKIDGIKKEGRVPFFHFTNRAGDILQGQMIDEILADIYQTFDKSYHIGFIVPNKYKKEIEKEIGKYGA